MLVESTIIVSVIVALGELWKKIFGDKVKKYIPLINLALGIMGAIIYLGGDLKIAVFEGIVIGLTASGLYSSVKNVKQAKEV